MRAHCRGHDSGGALLAVIITVLRGESANLLSVGAIDLGIIVDATVIMVENIYRHLAHYDPHEPRRRGSPQRRLDPAGGSRGRQGRSCSRS